QLFDDYADKFDAALVEKLDYRAPALLADALRRTLGEVSGLQVMDAGCGTGLAAPVLRPLAAWLEGVDLSPAMVAKARQRGLYDELREGELVQALSDSATHFDLVVAADVLVYLGDLEPVMRAARKALAPGGAFAFTVERCDDVETYVLGAKSRYAHAEGYVRKVAEQAGFTVALLEQAVTRRDAGADVPGLVAVVRL
ncbi:MAG TPA: methyltransferase domain-containing protein, partial [Candidatus Omnitrophota bacterium]|nr:methyltransferase domain-containing protein [Candidatus Omnitrophota bacterium]